MRLRLAYLPAIRSCALVVCAGALLAAPTGVVASSPDGFTHHLAKQINDYRARHGLTALVWSAELASMAAEHSTDMARRQALSHDGFRARRADTRSTMCVENVAHNYPTAEALLIGWRQSPAHHRNLLEPGVARMGLAATARYVTFFACR